MAVDTPHKRQSALSTSQLPGTVVPLPDDLIDATDRGMLVGQYSGIVVQGAARGVPMDEIVRLFISMIQSDAQLLALMGPGPGQVRWYYHGQGKVTPLTDPNLAYITYTYSQPGNTDSGVGLPIVLSIIWAKDRARCGEIRSRMITLFDKQTLVTDTGRKIRGRFMHEQDGFQTVANLAGRQAHFRFAYLDN